MRPVDADLIHAKLTALYKDATGAARRAYSDALDIVCDEDTVEVQGQEKQSVGHWKHVTFSVGVYKDNREKSPIGLSIVSGMCSECGKYSSHLMQYSPEMLEYCPHCGATMQKW